MSKYVLSDEVLAAIAKNVQLGMLTGTDVVDHLRLIELEPSTADEGLLVLTESSKERQERNINDMVGKAMSLRKDRS